MYLQGQNVYYTDCSKPSACVFAMYDSQFILGAILFTFIISRVYFLIFLWVGKPYRLFLANLGTLITVILLRAHGMAVDSPPDYVEAFAAYILPVSFWLAFDLYRWRRGEKEKTGDDGDSIRASGQNKP